jgi:hypothetical protein
VHRRPINNDKSDKGAEVSGLLELLRDNTSVPGRLVTMAVFLVVALVVAAAAGWLVGRRADDPYTRYYLRKAVRAVVVVVLLFALALVWQPFAGRIAVVLGFATAGLAFAMQEVIGALAGSASSPVVISALVTGSRWAVCVATCWTCPRCAPRSWKSGQGKGRVLGLRAAVHGPGGIDFEQGDIQ